MSGGQISGHGERLILGVSCRFPVVPASTADQQKQNAYSLVYRIHHRVDQIQAGPHSRGQGAAAVITDKASFADNDMPRCAGWLLP